MAVTLKGDWKLGDIQAFKVREGIYRFPFTTMDPTPGGQNLGRIEWCLEPVRRSRKREGRYWIDSLLIWARQTRDDRYQGVIFEIPCLVDCVTTHRYDGGSYYAGVWRMGYCPEHRNAIFEAYPENQHTGLKVDVYVSSATVEFD